MSSATLLVSAQNKIQVLENEVERYRTRELKLLDRIRSLQQQNIVLGNKIGLYEQHLEKVEHDWNVDQESYEEKIHVLSSEKDSAMNQLEQLRQQHVECDGIRVRWEASLRRYMSENKAQSNRIDTLLSKIKTLNKEVRRSAQPSSPPHKMKPYNFLKNHDYRKKRVQDAAEQLREAAGNLVGTETSGKIKEFTFGISN
uniref:Uncharacterized protein n=2 Tax=Caenorhabditis japonica TaxID=281687 RepID=A0A8R1EML9_CAEJA